MIKVEDIVYVRFRAPDLDQMEDFLIDFGMTRSERTETALYMRGTGPDPVVHVTELGEPGFVGLAFQAASEADLKIVSEAHGAPIEARQEPGGGARVLVHDLDGFPIEVVHGIKPVEVQPVEQIDPINERLDKPRNGKEKRMTAGPSHVHRLGHCVLNVTDYRKSFDWYHEQFGFLKSDEVYIGEKDAALGSFMRCDCGDRYVDHHTLFLVGSGKPGFNHAAWEVAGFDDLMLGRDALLKKDRTALWGVGRHVLGSQIFDYWRDPWGHTVEHWTDGDMFNASTPHNQVPVDQLLATQWGETAPPDMG